MRITISDRVLANLRSQAGRGNAEADAIMEILNSIHTIDLSEDTEGTTASDTIRVSGQIRDMDGNAISGAQGIRAQLINGTAGDTLTGTVSTGTAKAGDGSEDIWLETDANGAFALDVLLQNTGASQAGDVLLQLTLDDGTSELLKLTFA